MPDFPIIDSHVHLYDIERLSYAWLAAQPRLNRTHTLADFDFSRENVEVDGIVFAEVAVDPGLHLAEAAFVQGIAERDPRLLGMVAHAPVERGDRVDEDLDALEQFPTLRGIRRLIETERDPSFCLERNFIEGVRRVGRRGLTFDICVKHWALTHAIELARRCPEVAFVLDHLGKPGIRHGFREPWWGQLAELAALPNIVCKVSGVVTEADHARWTEKDIAPYVAHAIECFGFDRILYGSDWSVSNLTHRYPDWVAMLDRITAGCTEAEQRKLFRDNAIRVYRLSP